MTHIVTALPPSSWHGSERTAENVREQIRERFGDEAADAYDPETNARTFRGWLNVGFVVRKGEKALKSITIIEKKDKNGKVVAKIPKKVCLFFQSQVEPLEEKEEAV